MSLPDEQPGPGKPAPEDETVPPEVTFPENPVLPEGYTPIGGATRLPRARRRRARRMLAQPGTGERAALMERLARRAFPSIEFFLFALFCGTVLGAAYLLDSPAVLLLGLLLAPLLTPWAGLTLSIQTGSWRFFFQTLGGMLIASGLVFLGGALAGMAGHLWLPLPLAQANFHSHLWWPDLILVVLGAILMIISFVHTEQRPVLPSIMLAYGLFLPLSAGGLGLGLGAAPIWPNGGLVFLTYLVLSILVGGITLAALRFKPVRAGGYFLTILVGLLCLAALVYLTGMTTFIREGILATRQTVPTTASLALPSVTPTPTRTPIPSASETVTLAPTSTSLPSNTPLPTPTFAVISAPAQYGGAVVRSEPGVGEVILTLDNGSLVQVLPETSSYNGLVWVRIRTENNQQGWVLQDVLSPTTNTFSPAPVLTPTP